MLWCRGHYNLGNLKPGEVADLWIDIGVPKKTGQEKKGGQRKRDKIIGFFAGAKGNQQEDVKDCRAHIQVCTLDSPKLSSPACKCSRTSVIVRANWLIQEQCFALRLIYV